MGDAVTGISRADSASGEIERDYAAPIFDALQPQWGRQVTGPQRDLTVVSAPLTTSHHASHLRAAYPPSRESCMRGADRATVDKRFWSTAACADAKLTQGVDLD